MNKSYVYLGILIIVALVVFKVGGLEFRPAGIIGASEITLTSDAKWWLVNYNTVGEKDTLVFQKDTSRTVNGVTYKTTKETKIVFTPIDTLMYAPPLKIINNPLNPTGELQYSVDNLLCAFYGSTRVVPYGAGVGRVRVAYKVDVYQDGVLLESQTVASGGPNSTTIDKLSFLGGKITIENVGQFEKSINVLSLSDFLYLMDLDSTKQLTYDWQATKSRTTFESKFMTICDTFGKRWQCNPLNLGGATCYNYFRDTAVKQVQNAYGYYGFNGKFMGFATIAKQGPFLVWNVTDVGIAQQIKVAISADLGTMKVEPSVPKPLITSTKCPEIKVGNTAEAYMLVFNAGDIGTIQGQAQVASGNVQIVSDQTIDIPIYSRFSFPFTYQVRANGLGSYTLKFKACPYSTFGSVQCVESSCTGTTTSVAIPCDYDGYCETGQGETNQTCSDCTSIPCGDGKCEGNEAYTCPKDCPTPPPPVTCDSAYASCTSSCNQYWLGSDKENCKANCVSAYKICTGTGGECIFTFGETCVGIKELAILGGVVILAYLVLKKR